MEDFYLEFFSADPRIAPLFAKTNMEKQREVLKNALTILMMFDHGSVIATGVLRDIGKTHGTRGLRITAELYGIWKDALLRVVARSDPQYSRDVEAAWRQSLQRSIDFILEHQAARALGSLAAAAR